MMVGDGRRRPTICGMMTERGLGRTHRHGALHADPGCPSPWPPPWCAVAGRIHALHRSRILADGKNVIAADVRRHCRSAGQGFRGARLSPPIRLTSPRHGGFAERPELGPRHHAERDAFHSVFSSRVMDNRITDLYKGNPRTYSDTLKFIQIKQSTMLDFGRPFLGDVTFLGHSAMPVPAMLQVMRMSQAENHDFDIDDLRGR